MALHPVLQVYNLYLNAGNLTFELLLILYVVSYCNF